MSSKLYEIRDAVHGFALLDEQEWEIINHPTYQRLRRIKQLSLTDMVYPGATHTRFEHSIGVMQMATDFYDSIINKPRARALLEERYRFNEAGIERYRKIVRLAALLHDIGHSPFSHAGEGLMPIKEKGVDGASDKRFKHEEYSIAIIKEQFRDLIEKHPINSSNYNISVEEVTALLGDNTRINALSLLFKELISGQLDADRADYLLRDSIHVGVNYGLYDRNRLINCIDIGQTHESEDLVLAIQEGGWHIAESLVLARYQMFSQVYFHKTRRAYDYHITSAVKSILTALDKDSEGCYPTPDRLDKYIEFDDWMMHGLLKGGAGGEHGQIILNRNHYRKVDETEGYIPSEMEIKRIENTKEQLEAKGIKCFVDNVAPNWYKIDKDIWICDEGKGFVYELSKRSPIVKSMVNAPRKLRVYAEKCGGEE